MNPDFPTPESDWEKNVRRARGDTPPAIDLAELHRVVREAALAEDAPRRGWAEEFTALFGTPRTVVACCTLALACALLTSWEVSDARDSMSWAELISPTTGGVP